MNDKSQIEREVLDTYHRFVALRDRIDEGEAGWDALADFFTEDGVYIDPAMEATKNSRMVSRPSWRPQAGSM